MGRLLDRIVPSALPPSLRWAILFYLAHLVCLGWIASSSIFLGLAVIAAALAFRRGHLQIPFSPLYFPLALFLAGSTLSALFAPEPFRSLDEVGEWFSFLALPLALALHHTYPRTITLALRAFMVLAVIVCGSGLAQYFLLGYDSLDRRITGPAPHVMTLSGILLPLAILFLVLAVVERHRIWMVGAFLTSLTLSLTFTRSAWLGWLAGLLAVTLRARPRLLGFALPLLLIIVTLSPLPFFGRLVSTFDITQTSNLDRIRMVEAGMEMIRDRPLLGVGPSNVREIYPLYRAADAPRFQVPHLHNNIVQIWAERGFLPLAGYLLLVGFFITLCARVGGDAPREAREYADAGIGIAAGLAVAGVFEFNFGDTEVLLTMLNLFALCEAVIRGGRVKSEE